jgi:hypothetical protein
MMRRVGLIGVACAALSGTAAAQSMQKFSIQGSGAVVFPTAAETDFQNNTRLGWEVQLRYTFSRFSLGGGYQRATVYKLDTGTFTGAVSVGFLEPRYVVAAGSRLAAYLAGRLGASKLLCDPKEDCADQSLQLAVGGGGGVLVKLGSRVAVDLGSQYFATRYNNDPAVGGTTSAGYVLARLGLSVGL